MWGFMSLGTGYRSQCSTTLGPVPSSEPPLLALPTDPRRGPGTARESLAVQPGRLPCHGWQQLAVRQRLLHSCTQQLWPLCLLVAVVGLHRL